MSFHINWLFDWLWKREVPRAVVAGTGEIAYLPISGMEEETGMESPGGSDRNGSVPGGWAPGGSAPGGSDRKEAEPEESAEEGDEYAETEEEPDRRGGRGWFPPRSLPAELHYLYELIRYRIGQALHPDEPKVEPIMPAYRYWQLPIGRFILDYDRANPPLTANDARLLLIAVVTHVQPDLFDQAIGSVLNGESDFPPIGGSRGKNFRGFIPTGQTAIFLFAGNEWKRDLLFQELFWADHVFARNKILWLGEVEPGEPLLSGRIILSQDYIDTLVHDKVISPHHNINFPAKLITTTRERTQLVINEQLTEDFNHVMDWVKHKKEVAKRWQDGKKGYRCLFHGPSGTGKTFATCILGKETRKEVYRIDLSLVISKFIGETEKNLEMIFARAENKDWILFFDEADALFGKRTNIRDAHDKYANQEASYLLQRIEDYDGLVILATNMKNNIDESFLRRFDSDLKFTMPGIEERRRIWEISFPENVEFMRQPPAGKTLEKLSQQEEAASAIPPGRPVFYRYHRRQEEKGPFPVLQEEDGGPGGTSRLAATAPLVIPDLVKGYVLSGGNIQNVVHYATIRAATRQANPDAPLVIYLEDVHNGIKRELNKNGIPLDNKKHRSWDNPQQD